jgi:hypothetical protein
MHVELRGAPLSHGGLAAVGWLYFITWGQGALGIVRHLACAKVPPFIALLLAELQPSSADSAKDRRHFDD